MQAARVPLEIIRDEIKANQGFYFARDAVDRILREFASGVYGLRDDSLIQPYEPRCCHS
jgi:hypothetical protein